MEPTVSVVIPCHNLGQYLDEAVESVLAQSFDDFDIIVVDDGSDDPSTCGLLARYTKPRTRILRTPNRGLPAAKNAGIAECRGKYVTMLDADDRFEPSLLEKSVAALEADGSLSFVSHWIRTFGDETWDWTPTDCGFPALLDSNTVNGAAVVRRADVVAAGGFDESMRHGCEDWDLWITLVERGCRGRILPEFLFGYRRRAGSMSRLMMEGDRHPQLYRQLAVKHADSFRAHLEALLSRREGDISHLQRHIHDLRIEQHDWLTPHVNQWRDNVATLRRRAARARTVAETERQVGSLTTALTAAESTLAELEAAVRRHRGEAENLRRSWSWRITAPLRVCYGALLSAVKGPK